MVNHRRVRMPEHLRPGYVPPFGTDPRIRGWRAEILGLARDTSSPLFFRREEALAWIRNAYPPQVRERRRGSRDAKPRTQWVVTGFGSADAPSGQWSERMVSPRIRRGTADPVLVPRGGLPLFDA